MELKKTTLPTPNPKEELTAQDITDTKTTLELQNVDNTSDADKPVSTAQQSALDLKQDILAEGAFVDGDKSKLDGIEDGAEVNPDLSIYTEKGGYNGTAQDLFNAIGAANGIVFNELILDSKGNQYDISGLTNAQKATTLQTAIDTAGSDSWVYVPPGTYLGTTSNPTITITNREFTLFSLGRSQAIIQNTGGGHGILVDGTAQIVYRGNIANLAFITSGGDDGQGNETGDGLHLDGSGVTSYRATNLHFITTGRDGIHCTNTVTSFQVDAQVTDNSVSSGIGRYTVYDDSGQTFEITDGDNHKFYFDVNSEGGIIYNKTLKRDNFGATDQNYLTDLGTNNKLVTAHAYQTFRKNDTKNIIPIGGYLLPVNTAIAHYNMNRLTDDDKFLDSSSNGNDANFVEGTAQLADSDYFGKLIDFDGSTSYLTTGLNGRDLGSSFFIAFWVKPTLGDFAILYSNNLEFTLSSTQIKARLAMSGASVSTPSLTVESDRWQQVCLYYHGTDVVLESLSNNSRALQNRPGGSLTLQDLQIGKRFSKFFTGQIAHFVIMDNYHPDYVVGHYNIGVRSFGFSQQSLDRGGKNQMRAPFNPVNLTTVERDALSGLKIGATIWNTTTGALESWNGSAWV